MFGRRGFMKGAAGAVAAAPAMQREALAQRAAQLLGMLPMSPPQDVVTGYVSNATSPAVSVPKEAWDARDAINARQQDKELNCVSAIQRAQTNVQALRSVKPSMQLIYINREYRRLELVERSIYDSMFGSFDALCERLNLPNPFGRGRRKPRTSDHW